MVCACGGARGRHRRQRPLAQLWMLGFGGTRQLPAPVRLAAISYGASVGLVGAGAVQRVQLQGLAQGTVTKQRSLQGAQRGPRALGTQSRGACPASWGRGVGGGGLETRRQGLPSMGPGMSKGMLAAGRAAGGRGSLLARCDVMGSKRRSQLGQENCCKRSGQYGGLLGRGGGLHRRPRSSGGSAHRVPPAATQFAAVQRLTRRRQRPAAPTSSRASRR